MKTLEHKDTCSICDSKYDEDAGGLQGYFGIIPVTFCEWCYASIYDMIYQQVEEDFKENNPPEPCGMSRK